MQTIPSKSWNAAIPSSKKYEVVFETPLQMGDDDEPDVVVFDRCRGWSSIMAIEICKSDEITDMLIIARDMMDKYSLLDFFLFDEESGVWYNIKRGSLGYQISSDALFLGVALDKLKD